MPRNEDVFPSRSPRRFPALIWTTGGSRFGLVDAGARGALGASSAKPVLPAPARAPPTSAVVVVSMVRRFIWPNGCWVESFIFASLRGILRPRPRGLRTVHLNTALPAEVFPHDIG